MPKTKPLIYQNFNLRDDPDALRFFVCSAFEIFYKLEKKGTVVRFEFFNIGSYFLSTLLNDLASSLVGKNNEEALLEIEKIKEATNNHQYLGSIDKRRFGNFLRKLETLFPD